MAEEVAASKLLLEGAEEVFLRVSEKNAKTYKDLCDGHMHKAGWPSTYNADVNDWTAFLESAEWIDYRRGDDLRTHAQLLDSAVTECTQAYELFGKVWSKETRDKALETKAKVEALVFSVKLNVGLSKVSESQSRRKRYARTQKAKLESDKMKEIVPFIPAAVKAKLKLEAAESQ